MVKRNKNIKNICLVTEDFYPDFIGGQGIYGKNLVEQLAKKGISVTVLAENRGDRKKFWIKKKNIKLILVPFCFGNQLLLGFWEYLNFIIYERKNYYDVVHANQLSGFFFALFKPKNVGKLVLSIHNTNYDMSLETESIVKKIFYQPLIFLEAIMYRYIEGFLFNSPDEEKAFIKHYPLKNIQTKSVYLGYDRLGVNKFEKEKLNTDVKKELHLPKDAKIVLFVGRMVKRKKVETLIKAMDIINNDNVYTVLIGKGSDINRLQAISPSNVKFLGFVEDTKKYFLLADLFVLTSVAEGGFSLSVLEAASYGLPLIVSPSASGFPIIRENKNGYIVNPDNSENLAEKILLTLKNQNKFSKESLRLSKNFSWEKTARETLDFYQSLL